MGVSGASMIKNGTKHCVAYLVRRVPAWDDLPQVRLLLLLGLCR
jgi:hypothetical protein